MSTDEQSPKDSQENKEVPGRDPPAREQRSSHDCGGTSRPFPVVLNVLTEATTGQK